MVSVLSTLTFKYPSPSSGSMSATAGTAAVAASAGVRAQADGSAAAESAVFISAAGENGRAAAIAYGADVPAAEVPFIGLLEEHV